jgi:hypothetical protein
MEDAEDSNGVRSNAVKHSVFTNRGTPHLRAQVRAKLTDRRMFEEQAKSLSLSDVVLGGLCLVPVLESVPVDFAEVVLCSRSEDELAFSLGHRMANACRSLAGLLPQGGAGP